MGWQPLTKTKNVDLGNIDWLAYYSFPKLQFIYDPIFPTILRNTKLYRCDSDTRAAALCVSWRRFVLLSLWSLRDTVQPYSVLREVSTGGAPPSIMSWYITGGCNALNRNDVISCLISQGETPPTRRIWVFSKSHDTTVYISRCPYECFVLILRLLS
jgi:hypothetical protein